MNPLSPKLATSALAGALSAILVWALNKYVHADIPAEIASAITTVISAVTGWLTPRSIQPINP